MLRILFDIRVVFEELTELLICIAEVEDFFSIVNNSYLGAIMNRTFAGKVTATQLATHGKGKSLYGYLSVQTDSKKGMKFKVDFQTDCETITVGDQVIIEAESLGNQGVWIARRILKDIYVKKNEAEEAVT